MSQAEVKPFKVGEPLPAEAAGNPEPSTLIEIIKGACVETGRKVCLRCRGEIPSHKYRNAKFCSDRCRSITNTVKSNVKRGKLKNPGVGSGGAQWGTNNHMYRTGIGTFSKRAFEHYGRKCNRCGSLEKLLVHHQDEDRTNNVLENLEVLCKRCHQQHHCVRDAEGKYTQRDSPSQ